MNLNSDNGGSYWQDFNAAVMINGFNYCAENISAVTKSGITNPGEREYGANHTFAISPTKFYVNTTVSAWSFFVNPVIGVLYFGLEAFYPGGVVGALNTGSRLSIKNQRILNDPGWNVYRERIGGGIH